MNESNSDIFCRPALSAPIFQEFPMSHIQIDARAISFVSMEIWLMSLHAPTP